MPFVYLYIDTKDNIVKYVGIVNGNKIENLDKRIYQHQATDWWKKDSIFKINYMTVSTKSEAEFIESCLISKFHTDKYYNRSKAGWGESKLYTYRAKDFVPYVPPEKRNQSDEMDNDFNEFESGLSSRLIEAALKTYQTNRALGIPIPRPTYSKRTGA